MIRHLASVKVIDMIEPIEDADRIEVAVIGGWKVVVGKGEFEAGDQAGRRAERKCFQRQA